MLDALFAQQAEPGPLGGALFFPFMIALMVMFWVVVVLPQSRRQRKAHEAMLAALKRGNKVLTSSGIVGIIVGAKDGDDEVVIRSEDSKFRIKRNTVVQVLGSDESEASKT